MAARGRKSREWGDEHWTRRAKADGMRARSAYKLEQLQSRFRLLRPGMAVLDLGAAPGGFAQVAAKHCGPKGMVLAIDLQPIAPISGVESMELDLCSPQAPDRILDHLRGHGGRAFDLVLSDMAPPLSGIADADQAAAERMWQACLGIARTPGVLVQGGALVCKTFAGSALTDFDLDLRRSFAKVRMHRNPVTRAASKELYAVAQGFRATAPDRPQGQGEI